VPSGFLTTAGLALTGPSSSELKERFFADGPTSVFRILTSIDERLAGINQRALVDAPACLLQTPVAYTLDVFGQSVDFYGQCYEVNTHAAADDPSLVQFAVVGGVTYLYVAVGQERVAAIVRPVVGAVDEYTVQAWMGVGY